MSYPYPKSSQILGLIVILGFLGFIGIVIFYIYMVFKFLIFN